MNHSLLIRKNKMNAVIQKDHTGYVVSNVGIQELELEAGRYAKMMGHVLEESQRIIVGQRNVLKKIMIAVIANGHVLLEGVPGLAKTRIVRTISDILGLDFVRIQFTPDLLPGDILGTRIYKNVTGSFVTEKGPVFHNIILADEINRAPPKVQSALLEAMQERQVSIYGETFELKKPFLVLATQNPIESEGTYRLPEAQVDRFALKILIEYPSIQEEIKIIERNTSGTTCTVNRMAIQNEIVRVQRFNERIYADGVITRYIADIVNATRNPKEYGLDIDGMIEFGASPRASIWLMRAAKANALLEARGYVIPEDVKAVVHEVLRHRIVMTFEAEANGICTDRIIDVVINGITSP